MIKFITKLQNSDDATKKKWLIILSSISMVVVVGFWLLLTNLSTSGLSLTSTATTTANTGFVANAVDFIKRRTLNTWEYFKSKLYQPKEIVISKETASFVPKVLNQVPPVQLPNTK